MWVGDINGEVNVNYPKNRKGVYGIIIYFSNNETQVNAYKLEWVAHVIGMELGYRIKL